MTLYSFLEELIIIAERADSDRLLVLWPQFQAEYPALAKDIEHCLTLQPPEIRPYLTNRYDLLQGVFAMMRSSGVTRVDKAFAYLHAHLKGRL